MNASEIYQKWRTQIDDACAISKVSPATLCGLIEKESGGNPEAIGDGGAARGLGQMHNDACETVCVSWENQLDPNVAIPSVAAYLAFCIEDLRGDEKLGLMAYNQGPTVIKKAYAYMVGVLTFAQSWTSASTTAMQS